MPTVGYKPTNRLTAEELEVRVWAFVIVVLVLILFGAMVAFLYSVTYVTQPMAGIAYLTWSSCLMISSMSTAITTED